MTSDSSIKNITTSFLNDGEIEYRTYQKKIAEQCVSKNSLVVLPTGLGKTIIAVLVTAKTLEQYPTNSKVIMMAPTRPLINQHYESFLKFLKVPEEKFFVITGQIDPNLRADLYYENQLLFYTPQTLRNDLVNRRYSLKETCLVIFDEAHHAVGDYPYTLIADEYEDQNPDGIILGLTASPGSSKKKIDALCKNIHVSPQNTHFRTRKDKDVKLYLKLLDIYKIGVDLTELMEEAYSVLRFLTEERLQYLSQLSFLDVKADLLFEKVIRKDLLKLNKHLIQIINSDGDKTGAYSAISVNAQALILYHMIELIEQQGLDNLLDYLEKMYKDARKSNSSKALRFLASDHRLHKVYLKLKETREFSPDQLIHPKYHVLEKILLDEINHNPNSRILVFVKFRVSVKNITNRLKKINHIKPVRFVGQASKSHEDKGLTQKKQVEILTQFKQGVYNVLVSTNVGEEGLDIAECDLVVFYDVVASEIRYIQRRGRTARHREGKVIILYCKNTNDEIYMKIALKKLKKMDFNLKNPHELNHHYNHSKLEEASQSIEDTTLLDDHQRMKSYRQTQSNLEMFIEQKEPVSLEQPEELDVSSSSKEIDITLSKDLPMEIGLRKRLTEADIPFEVLDTPLHIIVKNRVVIQIYDMDKSYEELVIQALKFNTRLRSQYTLIINVFNFIHFKESVKQNSRLLKRDLERFGKEKHIKMVMMDSAEILYFMVKNLYEYDGNKKGEES